MKGAVRLFVLAAALFQAHGSIAMTPALLDPAVLAGTWTLSGPAGKPCRLVLRAAAAPDGQGLALDLGGCAAAGLEGVSNWRVSSDGFALAGGDRSTVLFFSSEGGGRFAAKARDGRRFTLVRAR